jgi:ADP-ribose pyrophosphatase
MNERMYLYLCEDLRPGPGRPELDEELETVIVPWQEAMAMTEDGRIEDAKTLLALMICERLRRPSPA